MKKAVMLAVSLSIVSLMLVPATTSLPSDFEVVWNIMLPRQTYFIGETVTFTVIAFASNDPELRIPGEMAQITIRNQSMVEVYSTWITTNANGSSPVQFDIDLVADVGNYTIILDPLNGDNVHEEFNVLFNEETYWKERVNQLEDEINKQYEYINYLFTYNNWLTKKVKWVTDNFRLMWIMVFGCLLIGIYCGLYISATLSPSAKGIMSTPSKLTALLGIKAESPLYLPHEEVAQIVIPTNKMPPIYGHDFECQICAKRGLPVRKMTKREYEDHIWTHDKLALKRDSVTAHYRAWKDKRAEERGLPKPVPEPMHGTVEEYAEQETEMDKLADLKARLKKLRKMQKKGMISEQQLAVELKKIRADKEKLTPMKKPEVFKQTTPAKVEKRPQPQQEKALSGNPRTRRLRTDFGPAISESEKPLPSNPTAIDELYDKLNNEKVN